MNKHIFGSRKGGATIKGRFFRITTSEIIAKQLERKNRVMELRQRKRGAKDRESVSGLEDAFRLFPLGRAS